MLQKKMINFYIKSGIFFDKIKNFGYNGTWTVFIAKIILWKKLFI